MTANFRPGQRLRHTGRNEIVIFQYAYDGSAEHDTSVVTVTDPSSKDDEETITVSTHLLEPATAVAPIPPALLAELADWLDNLRENEHEAGALVESINYKLRALAGEDLTQTDLLPVSGEWPTLQRAMDDAEHNAGGGCDMCPKPADPYVRIAELETDIAELETDLGQWREHGITAASTERLRIIDSLRKESDRVRNLHTGRSYNGLVAGIISVIADKINDGTL